MHWNVLVIHINIAMYFSNNYYARAKGKVQILWRYADSRWRQQRGSSDRGGQIWDRTGDFRENGIETAFAL